MTPSITESQILAALRSFLIDVLPSGVSVIKAQSNVVPQPSGDNFVLMTPIYRKRISTTVQSWDYTNSNPTTTNEAESTRIDVQLDFHGEQSTDNMQVATTLFRSPVACDFMLNLNVQPLWCDEGRQVPFINGEGQYEDRWIVEAVLQATPNLSTPQQFADTLAVTLADENAWSDLA